MWTWLKAKLTLWYSRLDVRLGLRLMLAAMLAMVLARLLNLPTFYWAGISAILVSTGRGGGSFRASLVRFSVTLVGLTSGTLMAVLVHQPLLASALSILMAILLCQALGLGAAVRVGALTTLFPVVAGIGAHSTAQIFSTAMSRVENVLVGCAMALLLDAVLWPERSAIKLQERIRKDMAQVGRMVREVLHAYLEFRPWPEQEALLALQAGRLTYSQLLDELGSEPEDPQAPREALAHQAEAVHRMVDHCAALSGIQVQAQRDTVQRLLESPLKALATRIAEASEAFGSHAPSLDQQFAALTEAELSLEAAYETIRGDRGTQGYPSSEVFRLLGVLYHCGAVVRGLSGLELAQKR